VQDDHDFASAGAGGTDNVDEAGGGAAGVGMQSGRREGMFAAHRVVVRDLFKALYNLRLRRRHETARMGALGQQVVATLATSAPVSSSAYSSSSNSSSASAAAHAIVKSEAASSSGTDFSSSSSSSGDSSSGAHSLLPRAHPDGPPLPPPQSSSGGGGGDDTQRARDFRETLDRIEQCYVNICKMLRLFDSGLC
jgi:hypothetical protein